MYSTIAVFLFFTTAVIGDVTLNLEAQERCYDLCSSCNGIASFVNNRCECNLKADAEQGTKCMIQMKRHARMNGLSLVSCDNNNNNNNQRSVRCLKSKNRYNANDIEHVAKYFMQDGPIAGSIFASGKNDEIDKYVASPSEIVINIDGIDEDDDNEDDDDEDADTMVAKPISGCPDSPSTSEKPSTEPPSLKQEEPTSNCNNDDSPQQVTTTTTVKSTTESKARKSNDGEKVGSPLEDTTANPDDTNTEETPVQDNGESNVGQPIAANTDDNEITTTPESPKKCSCNCADNNEQVASPNPFTNPTVFLNELSERLAAMLGFGTKPLNGVSKNKPINDLVKAPRQFLKVLLERVAAGDDNKVSGCPREALEDEEESPRSSNTKHDELIVQPNIDDASESPIVSATNSGGLIVQPQLDDSTESPNNTSNNSEVEKDPIVSLSNIETSTSLNNETSTSSNNETSTSSNNETSTSCPEARHLPDETEVSELNPSERTSNKADTSIVNPVLSVPTSTHIYLPPLPMYQSPMITRVSPLSNCMSQFPMSPYFPGTPLGMSYYPNYNAGLPYVIRTARSRIAGEKLLDQQQKNVQKKFIDSFIPIRVMRNIELSKKSRRKENNIDSEEQIQEHKNPMQDIKELFKIDQTTTQKPLIETLGYKSELENLLKKRLENQTESINEIPKAVSKKSKLTIKPIKEIIKKFKGPKKISEQKLNYKR